MSLNVTPVKTAETDSRVTSPECDTLKYTASAEMIRQLHKGALFCIWAMLRSQSIEYALLISEQFRRFIKFHNASFVQHHDSTTQQSYSKLEVRTLNTTLCDQETACNV